MDFRYSSLSTYYSCQKKYYYQWILKYRRIAAESALIRGGAIHDMLDVWQKTKDINLAMEAAKEYITKTDLFAEEKSLLVSQAVETMRVYQEGMNDIKYTVVSTEVEFIFDMPSLDEKRSNKLAMHLDGIILLSLGGNDILFLLENKTTKMIPSNWEQKYNMDNQALGYLWGLKHQTLNIDWRNVRGMVLNLIRVPMMDSRSKYGELVRSVYFPLEELITEWYMETVRTILEIERKTTEGTYSNFPKNTAACFDYNKPCQYLGLCNKTIGEKEVPFLFNIGT